MTPHRLQQIEALTKRIGGWVRTGEVRHTEKMLCRAVDDLLAERVALVEANRQLVALCAAEGSGDRAQRVANIGSMGQ